MTSNEVHLEIAKERFLELMAAQPDRDPRSVAFTAIKQADEFDTAYRQIGLTEDQTPARVLKGCRECFGSGGKRGKPCKTCSGTGKVEAA